MNENINFAKCIYNKISNNGNYPIYDFLEINNILFNSDLSYCNEYKTPIIKTKFEKGFIGLRKKGEYVEYDISKEDYTLKNKNIELFKNIFNHFKEKGEKFIFGIEYSFFFTEKKLYFIHSENDNDIFTSIPYNAIINDLIKLNKSSLFSLKKNIHKTQIFFLLKGNTYHETVWEDSTITIIPYSNYKIHLSSCINDELINLINEAVKKFLSNYLDNKKKKFITNYNSGKLLKNIKLVENLLKDKQLEITKLDLNIVQKFNQIFVFLEYKKNKINESFNILISENSKNKDTEILTILENAIIEYNNSHNIVYAMLNSFIEKNYYTFFDNLKYFEQKQVFLSNFESMLLVLLSKQNNKINELVDELEYIENRVSDIESDISGLQYDFGSIEDNISSIKNMILNIR